MRKVGLQHARDEQVQQRSGGQREGRTQHVCVHERERPATRRRAIDEQRHHASRAKHFFSILTYLLTYPLEAVH